VVLNPQGKPAQLELKDGRLVSLDAVKEALDKKRRIVIADARPPSDWLNLHIPGAISTPYYDLASLDDIPNDGTWVIAYCACPHHASGAVVDELRKRGYPHTAVLDEGIFAWQHKGYPVVAAPGMLPPPAPPVPPR
jgi:cytochrome c oxidase cbb3-type subunit 3